MRTIEEEYQYIKSQFISLSRSIHLGYNTYDPLFTVAADAVRQVCKVEPISEGARRKNDEYEASVILVAIMINQTNITHTLLSKMMLKKSHGKIGRDMGYHWANYDFNKAYTEKYDKVLQIVKDTDLCKSL